MKNLKLALLSLLISSLVGGFIFLIIRLSSRPKEIPPAPLMMDNSMEGILEGGREYKMLEGYYEKNPIKRDDLIYFTYSETEPPVIRRIVGIPGDQFDVVWDKKAEGWKLIINGESVLIQGKLLVFGDKHTPVLKKYVEPRGGVLKAREMLVLSNTLPPVNDSTTFGVIQLSDYIGKIEPVK